MVSRASLPDRRHNAAAGRGNRLVAGARQAPLELSTAITGKHEMGVAVDQPGG